jgi:excisionase family DNA binding protein
MSRHLDNLFLPYPSYLTVTNLAELFGVTQKTAYEYLQSGEVPSYRIGSRWLILRDEVKEFIETCATPVRALSEAGADANDDVNTDADMNETAAAA